MAQGSWLFGATWEKAAVDCMWHCLQSMLDCYNLASTCCGNICTLVKGDFTYLVVGCKVLLLICPGTSFLGCFNEVDDTRGLI
jgi:hypothetical protein